MKLTFVTGLWNIGRENLIDFKRDFFDYLERLSELLDLDYNFIVFGEKETLDYLNHGFLIKKGLEDNKYENKKLIERSIDWIKDFPFILEVNRIRSNKEWYNQASWLEQSPQCKLELYNPLVMSKMFLLHDAKLIDSFKSDYFIWIDAGILNTVPKSYLSNKECIEGLIGHLKKFFFICYPYETNSEIHGFKKDKIDEICSADVNRVARGGIFGGHKDYISKANDYYYSILSDTLSKGLMGTEESIFTIMTYNDPNNYYHSMIENDGLIYKFFDNILNNKICLRMQNRQIRNIEPNVDVYFLSYEFPEQFELLLKSFEIYPDFLTKTNKYLINNSISEKSAYESICAKYGVSEIHKGKNLGICGGRMFAAEHFNSSNSDYYLFFEDDMFFHQSQGVCKNGFQFLIQDLYNKLIGIQCQEEFDYLKLNFTEFFGDNSEQWAWNNFKDKGEGGFENHRPKTKIFSLDNYRGLCYLTGEFYYCNWVLLMNKNGNQKIFDRSIPMYEQFWMKNAYLNREKIKAGCLLASPTHHNRVYYYEPSLRKEN